MDLRNCPECGKVFVYIHTNLCPACKKNEEEDFLKVNAYLRDHPQITIFELSEETGVDEVRIVKWVREGRIEGKSYPGLAVSCERCGKLVQSGRYCIQCSNELARGFTDQEKREEKQSPDEIRAKFHIKENKRS